ncbi:MFS transporter [Kocuria palustris]|uniref:MFS transporter n=2 Tax=Kocuria palustris TaxID=71999 RepID=UPI0021A357AE|nr:MFS transporter [Kocuria palustris]MCT1591493.1 MFS transporter [Kocuria palustris]
MQGKLWLLMLTLLVVTMSELQTAGMLPYMARDLGVSTGDIGLLVSVYALGMAIGGPILAIALRKGPPRGSLVLVVAAYGIIETLAPIIHEYWWLALIRLLTGCLAGAMFGLCVSFGARLAPSPDRIGPSIAIVMSGLMVGTVFGLPLSHFIAERWGWQVSFYALGIASLLVCLIDRAALPGLSAADTESASQDARNLKKPALWWRFMVSLLTIGATYGAFSYFTPLLEQNAGFSPNATTVILFAYGLCTVVGNLIVGKFADDHAVGVLRLGHSLLFISLVLISLFSDAPGVTLTFVLVVGLVGVTMNPAMITRVVEVGGSGNLVSTVHTAVITSGVMVGTAISAGAMGIFGDNPTVATWTGAVLAVLAALVLATQSTRQKQAAASDRAPAQS